MLCLSISVAISVFIMRARCTRSLTPGYNELRASNSSKCTRIRPKEQFLNERKAYSGTLSGTGIVNRVGTVTPRRRSEG